jgi:FlaA1/EpsC-like NDP-sugar epimerase
MQLVTGTRVLTSGRVLFLYDLLATGLSVAASFLLRFETLDPVSAIGPFLPVALLPLFVRPPLNLAFGLYHREWRFASTRELRDIVSAVTLGSLIIVSIYGVAALAHVPGTSPFPRSFLILEPVLTLLLAGGGRLFVRMRLERTVARRSSKRRLTPTLVFGAGDAGASVAQASSWDSEMGLRVVGFLDDDTNKRGSRLHGHRVYGGIDGLAAAVERTGAEQLLIAMPSRAGAPIRRAVTAAENLGLDVKVLPPMRNLITGQLRAANPRQVSVEDLLRRDPVQLDTAAIAKYLNGASVLVTGGGGSIGGELVRQILPLGPRVLTVIDYHEGALWGIERDAMSVMRNATGGRLTPVLADVRSETAIAGAIARARPDVVFHAAALKHVPFVELHPSEGVLTNVLGTRNVLAACEAARVSRFVMISTDKAVEPASMMGWTKRIAELLTIQAGQRTGLPYSAVRFGNVLGSSGSLVPLLERQLIDGLPLTITEPDATRYFMTLDESVALILEAGSAAESGAIYVLDMGQPVRIGDLVQDLVRRHGLEEHEVEWRVMGLRPGEKLHEKLFFDIEESLPTANTGILRATTNGSTPSRVERDLDQITDRLLDAALRADDGVVREIFRSLYDAEEAPLGFGW